MPETTQTITLKNGPFHGARHDARTDWDELGFHLFDIVMLANTPGRKPRHWMTATKRKWGANNEFALYRRVDQRTFEYVRCMSKAEHEVWARPYREGRLIVKM